MLSVVKDIRQNFYNLCVTTDSLEVAFAEMIRDITEHIEELPSTMKKVFKLYYLEGKKYKEIATELHSSPEAVRKQKARALAILKKKIPPSLYCLLVAL